jgi:hypothetical protein
MGGVFGLALAWIAIKILRIVHPSSIPSAETVAIDPTVLAFTALLCGVMGILFGIAPAWESSKVNLSETLKEGARGSGGFGKHRAVLVITETALASILFIGAGLSLKSLWRAETVNPGFDPQGVLTFRLAAPTQYSGVRIPLFYQQVLDRIQALPGVQSAVLARNLPMSGTDPSMAIEIEGTAPPPSEIPVVTRLRAVGPGYFSGLHTSLLGGREFTELDTAASQRVAVVSASLAKLYWPDQSALGKRIKPAMPGADWCVVVGIAADVHHWATKPTAPINSINTGLTAPFAKSPTGCNEVPSPPSPVASCAFSRLAIASNVVCACCWLVVSESRVKANSQCTFRAAACAFADSNCSGIQNSSLSDSTRKPAGITPTTV